MAKPNSKKDAKGDKSPSKKEVIDPLRRKYRSLYIWGLFFLAVGAAVLGYNHWRTLTVVEDVRLLNLANRQNLVAEKIKNSIDGLNREYAADASTSAKSEELFQRLSSAFEVYGKTQASLLHGGKAPSILTGEQKKISAIKDKEIRGLLGNLQESWKSLGDKLAIIVSQKSSAPIEVVNAAAELAVPFSNEASNSYLTIVDLKQGRLQRDLVDQRRRQSYITGGALFMYLWLLLIVIRGLKKKDKFLVDEVKCKHKKNKELERLNVGIGKAFERLKDKHQQLQEAQQMTVSAKESMEDYANEVEVKTQQLSRIKDESDAILGTVHHGLCLIDKNGVIGERVSKAMEDIFETPNLTGSSFINLMKPVLSEKNQKTLESYIQLQFKPKAHRKQLDKFNPLKKAEVVFVRDNGTHVTKHLGFDFKRIYDGAEISSVLVTVDDVSDKVSLVSDLKRAEHQKERQADLMFELVNLNSRDIRGYLSKAERELEQINTILREDKGSDSPKNQSEKVEKIYRSIHMLKGNASMLGLTTVVKNCEATEGELNVLRNEGEVSGDRFLASLVGIVKLKQTLSEIEEISDTLLTSTKLKTPPAVSGGAGSGRDKIIESVISMTKVASERANKPVAVDSVGFDSSHVHDSQSGGLEDVLIQLIRNSIAHGIEDKDTRLKAGKNIEGRIQISTLVTPEGPVPDFGPTVVLSYRDDGRGLDIMQIAERAVKKGFITSEQASQMTPQQLSAIIFKPGFSTSDKVSEDAGQGVGLDVVRDIIVNKLNGKLRIAYKAAKSFELTAYLPHKVG